MQNVAQVHRSSGSFCEIPSYRPRYQSREDFHSHPADSFYVVPSHKVVCSSANAPPSPPLTAFDPEYPATRSRFPRNAARQLPTPPASPAATGFEAEQQWAPTYLDPGRRLQLLSTLGSGAYGVVHLAKDVMTQIPYAVKVLNKFHSNGQPLDMRQQQFQQTEMQLHYEVSAHPNVVSLLRILDVANSTLVVMEYCPEGDLFSNITERGRYVGNDLAAKSVFLQILDAVSHCHRLGVYHRDLKPENILVTDGGHQVKLADFGLATTDKYSTDFGCGSTFYMSPECHDQSSGSAYYACAPNDIWSLGVILVNLTCGRNPWKSASAKDTTFKAYMQDRHFLKSILPISDELDEILGMIFELDPTKRITLDELRLRIVHCGQFTKRASEPVAPVEVIVEDYDTFSASLSPSSTVSEGSMISDTSDNSTVPSEVDSASEYDFACEVMDEDSNAVEDVVSVNVSGSKAWDSLPGSNNSYNSTCVPQPQGSFNASNQEKSSHITQTGPSMPSLQIPTLQKFSTYNNSKKTKRNLATRCITPSQLQLPFLSPFCPDSREQRRGASPIWRAF